MFLKHSQAFAFCQSVIQTGLDFAMIVPRENLDFALVIGDGMMSIVQKRADAVRNRTIEAYCPTLSSAYAQISHELAIGE